jgi:hypothetical protein
MLEQQSDVVGGGLWQCMHIRSTIHFQSFNKTYGLFAAAQECELVIVLMFYVINVTARIVPYWGSMHLQCTVTFSWTLRFKGSSNYLQNSWNDLLSAMDSCLSLDSKTQGHGIILACVRKANHLNYLG